MTAQAVSSTYRGFRGNIAIDRNALAATMLNPAIPLDGGRRFALAQGL
jgi:hypothetical protein